jgi:NADP-dependent 3-hydroxy-3-methylglutaryl-CoA reductase
MKPKKLLEISGCVSDQGFRNVENAGVAAPCRGFQWSENTEAERKVPFWDGHKPNRIPRFSRKVHYTDDAIQKRIQWARTVSGAKLTKITQSIFQPETLAGNIENYIGSVQIPIGLSGPLLVKGIHANGYIPVPIATTEGALVSSLTRGAMVCTMAGGIKVRVTERQMIRAPMFFCAAQDGAVNLEQWILKNFTDIKREAESVSSVARLKKVLSFVLDESLHVLFYYSTGDAAGQNMTTACTWAACEWIVKQIKNNPSVQYRSYVIEGNMSGDKKVNHNSLMRGRGVSVVGFCHIPDKILKRLLRVTAADFVRGWKAAEAGARQIGMMGSNINFANIIAGIFTATGQDIACVHESAIGTFKVRQEESGLQCSVRLPSLVIGTVGGGTKLPTQRECLELMGCYGNGKLFRLAEIIAAACLSLDLSTGSAILANEFVGAHERLGRNRPFKKLSQSEVDADFFTDMLFDRIRSVDHIRKNVIDNKNAIISKLAEEKDSGLYGLHRYRLEIRTNGELETLTTVLKIKPPDKKIINIGFKIARLTGGDALPGLYESQSHIFGFDDSSIREIEFYTQVSKDILHYCPKIYGTKCDPGRQIYAVLMEDLSRYNDSSYLTNPSRWDQCSIESVLSDIASIHSVYLERYELLPKSMKINILNEKDLRSASPLLSELISFNSAQYPALFPNRACKCYRQFLQDIDRHIKRMKEFPMTLTHNDFNPRNLFLRCKGEFPRLVLYDWELAFFQNPQRDLIEFLAFVLKLETPIAEFERFVDFYRQQFELKTGRAFPRDFFMQILYLNAAYFAVVRINLYLLGHNLLKFDFIERVCLNTARFVESAKHSF